VFPVLPQCLGSALPLPCVLLAVELLSVLLDHDSLAWQLCSHPGKAGQDSLNCPIVGREGLGAVQVQSPSRASVLVPQTTMKRGSHKLGVVAHSFNPSTQEAEAGGFLSSRPAWSTE
jgi:hypothetical protein